MPEVSCKRIGDLYKRQNSTECVPLTGSSNWAKKLFPKELDTSTHTNAHRSTYFPWNSDKIAWDLSVWCQEHSLALPLLQKVSQAKAGILKSFHWEMDSSFSPTSPPLCSLGFTSSEQVQLVFHNRLRYPFKLLFWESLENQPQICLFESWGWDRKNKHCQYVWC